MDPWFEGLGKHDERLVAVNVLDDDEGRRDALELFGAPRVRSAGAAAPHLLEWQKPAALLAYLACRPGSHSREALALVFRPEANERAGKAYLRGLLHRTRSLLPGLTALEVDDHRIGWHGWSDVRAFNEAMAREDWARAIELQQQPLLPTVGSTGEPGLDAWFSEERLRLRHRLSLALIGRIRQQQAGGESNTADLMQKLLDLDPLDESAVQMVLSYARSTLERHTASQGYHALRRRLLSEFGRQPLESTQELYARMREPAGGEAPRAAANPAAPPHTLPLGTAQAAPLGRERELQELARLLADPAVRVLTIHGPGGVGKTSVAQSLNAFARQQAGTETAWVELIAVETIHGLLDAIASQTGAPVHDGPVEQQLVQWLRGRRIIVFLDNFEQLTAHAGLLERWAQCAPDARFVVTSREALGLPGEYLYGLSGLACPGADAAAAKLLELNAARAGRPIADDEKADARELVKYLDGLPLAIEIAANWLTLLPIKAMLAELRNNPSFLDGACPRQCRRTMQSAFEGMWIRMDATEQETLLRLSMMQGPLDLQIVGAGAYAEGGVFLRLVRKSLLQRAGEGIFRMHHLMRGFVQARSGAQALRAARSRYTEQTLDSLAKLPALRPGMFMPEVVNRIRPYVEDFAQAWRFAIDDGRWELIEKALPNLSGFLLMASRHEMLIELMTYAAIHTPAHSPMRGRLAIARAKANLRLGRIDEAQALAMAAISVEPARSDARAALEALVSCVRRFHGDHAQAMRHALTALDSLGDSEDAFTRLEVQENLALCHWHLAQLPEAEGHLLCNLALASQQGARYAETITLCLLGILRNAIGRPAEALKLLQSSEQLFYQMQDSYRIAYCRRAMSYVYLRLGDLQRQAEMAHAALAIFTAEGCEHEIGESLFAVVLAHDAAGRATEAQDACRKALRCCLQVRQVPIALRCIGALGALGAVTERIPGLALMCFAAAHPALRRGDMAFIDRRLAQLKVTDSELQHARNSARALTFETICERLLGLSPPSDRPGAAQGPAPGSSALPE